MPVDAAELLRQLPVLPVDPEQYRMFFTAAGIVLCCFGWVLYSVGIRLCGVTLGLVAGVFLVPQIMILHPSLKQSWHLYLIIPLVLGISGWWLIGRIYTWLFFIAIAIGVRLVMIHLDTQPAWRDHLSLYLGVWVTTPLGYTIIAVIIALALCLLHRLVMMGLTGLLGGYCIGLAWNQLWLVPILVAGSIVAQAGCIHLLKIRPLSSDGRERDLAREREDDDDED